MSKTLFSHLLGIVAFSLAGLALLQAPLLYAQTRQVQTPQGRATDFPSGSYASLNWSGYVADEQGSYTSVTGSWVVPTVASGSTGRADATWVGIGGVHSQDLIQAGTQAVIGRTGRVSYQAWYEMLPDVSIPVSLAVSPGDSMTTTISQQSADVWHVVIHDNTTGQQYDHVFSYRSSLSSAEWVEERVSDVDGSFYPLDQFGSVTFSSGSTIKDGSVRTLSQVNAHPLSMVGASGVLASASSLDTNGSFTVTQGQDAGTEPAYAVAPAAPEVVSDPGSVIVISFGPNGISINRGDSTQADHTSSIVPQRYVRTYRHRGYGFAIPL
jgi:hypothetical protein